MEVKTIAVAILGGAFDHNELGDNDIACIPGALEELQEKHVTGSEDVQLDLIERSHFDRVTSERDALQLRLNAVEEENDRFKGMWLQELSRGADVGVDLAVSHELLRKAFFALLKGGHSKPLREEIKKVIPVTLCGTCNGYGKYQDGDSGTDEDGRCPNIVDCDCDDSERMPQYRKEKRP